MTIDPVVYRRRWKTLAVLSLSLVIIGLDNTILNVALPSLQTHFNASTSTLQWMVDSYLLVFAGMLLTMGTLGDRFGRKRALQGGLLLFGGASLAVLLVDTSNQLIALRAVMGIGGAMIMPATLSIISNVFPREERAKAIGIWAAMAAVGIGLGPLFGGILLEYFSWTSVFMVNVPVAFTALMLGFWLVPESRDPEPGRFDGIGAVLSMGALGTLVYAIIEAPEKGWTDPVVLSAFAAGTLLSALFVVWELRTSHPMLNLSFFRDPRFSVASGAIGLASFALFGGIFALTQFLQDARGYSALEAGCAMVPLAFGLVIGSGSSVKLVAKRGTTRVVMAGLLGLSAVLTSSLVWSYDMPYWPLGIAIFLLAVFMGWVMGPGTSSVMGSVPEEKAGVASAMNDVTRQVAGALGTAVIGSLISSVYQTRISDDTSALPAAARATAEDSVGGAHAVASSLPTVDASALVHASNVAYTDAMGIGFTAAAVVALMAAIAVRRWLPARQADVVGELGELPAAGSLSQAA
jgi:EmrB/QacA subfamily drug resistance transporter